MADDWQEHAACRGENPELFFPVGTSGPALREIEQAKEICRRCPVAAQCLAAALATGEDAGIWGGLTADERRVLKHGRDDGAAQITGRRAGAPLAESRTGRVRRTHPVQPPRQERSARTARRA